MTQEAKSIYTSRITNANATGIIDILFDMLFDDLADSEKAAEIKDFDALRESISHGKLVLSHLKDALDFKYELSYQLYPLYTFAQNSMEKTFFRGDPKGVNDAKKVISPLRDAFKEIAKNDNSPKVMQHTENMVAGMTYGRNDLNMTDASYDRNRGFTA